MIVSHQHRFIFFENGKAATTSVNQWLRRYDEESHLNSGGPLWATRHMPPSVARSILGPQIYDQYFKFVFVRDTFDWVVSLFFWNLRPRSPDKLYLGDVQRLYDHLRRFRGVNWRDSLFQSTYVVDGYGDTIVDFVGQVSSLQADVNQIAQTLGIPQETIARLNSVVPDRHRDYYVEASRNAVESLWKEDIDRFQFHF